MEDIKGLLKRLFCYMVVLSLGSIIIGYIIAGWDWSYNMIMVLIVYVPLASLILNRFHASDSKEVLK